VAAADKMNCSRRAKTKVEGGTEHAFSLVPEGRPSLKPMTKTSSNCVTKVLSTSSEFLHTHIQKF
jgi:hypothetical protein